jgi:hypothetical protein
MVVILVASWGYKSEILKHASLLNILTFNWPVVTYMNAHKKTPLQVHFIYFGNKEIYQIFKKCCIICVLFSTKCHSFHYFLFFCSTNAMFFINHVLKFKYHPNSLKVNNLLVCKCPCYFIHSLYCVTNRPTVNQSSTSRFIVLVLKLKE